MNNNKSLYEFKDYKKYLNWWVDRPGSRRGERSKMADSLSCHTGYISLILKGNSHLSLEQAEQMNRHLNHSEEESDFFMLLVQVARAGTPELKEFFLKKIRVIYDARLVLKNRLQSTQVLTTEDQMTFYSSWHYGALHVLSSVPGFQTKEAMAAATGVSIEKITTMLSFLERAGIVINDGNFWKVGKQNIFVDSNSLMVNRHHTNWRMQAIASLDKYNKEDLHYSAPIALSVDDFNNIRELFVELISKARDIVCPSKEEIAACYCIDFFRIG